MASRMPSCLRSEERRDRKSTRLNSSHHGISYAVFCLKETKYGWVSPLAFLLFVRRWALRPHRYHVRPRCCGRRRVFERLHCSTLCPFSSVFFKETGHPGDPPFFLTARSSI